MITKREKNKIIKVLGKHYASKVQSYLSEKGITTRRNGLPSFNLIRNVMNGGQHAEIENAIFECVAIEKEKNESEKQRRAEILGIKKAVAPTTA